MTTQVAAGAKPAGALSKDCQLDGTHVMNTPSRTPLRVEAMWFVGTVLATALVSVAFFAVILARALPL